MNTKKIIKYYEKVQKVIEKYVSLFYVSLTHFFRLRYRKFIFFIVFILLLVYLIILSFAPRIQGSLLFPGVFVNTISHTNPDYNFLKLEFEDINISYRGDNINGLFVDKKSDTTVYYFHGNGGDLSYFYHDIKYIYDLGFNVLALDYPGYGKSTGFPYEEDIMNYANELYTYAQKTYGITQENTIIWGYSIGTGIATQFSLGKNIKSLLLFASYSSLYDISKQTYGFVIQKLFFLPNSFQTDVHIKNITAPKLIIHGTDDSIIDFELGKKVFESAQGEKYFLEIKGGDHFSFYNFDYIDSDIKKFLQYTTLNQEIIEKIQAEAEQKKYEESQKAYLENLDFVSDTSFQKYVDSKIPFSNKGYIPKDMRMLQGKYISDTKGNAQMREEAANNFETMAANFYEDMGEKIVVVSSYRSYSYQAGIKSRGCPDNLCAKAGYSEHQSGLTADLWSASTQGYWNSSPRLMKYYTWLSENAHLYGFSNSYKNGLQIDGYDIEPWHWRYLGVEFATYLYEHNINFAEYFYSQKKG